MSYEEEKRSGLMGCYADTPAPPRSEDYVRVKCWAAHKLEVFPLHKLVKDARVLTLPATDWLDFNTADDEKIGLGRRPTSREDRRFLVTGGCCG